ncbi:hypothetical protein T492DRAFT_501707 [Pavlovales sp. CCMP2436]|nr:hypothetical protein T492DRAFT_501707 [Pavlovales sp. CCMP2436]
MSSSERSCAVFVLSIWKRSAYCATALQVRLCILFYFILLYDRTYPLQLISTHPHPQSPPPPLLSHLSGDDDNNYAGKPFFYDFTHD